MPTPPKTTPIPTRQTNRSEPWEQGQQVGINEILSSMRNVESGSYRGNYALYGPRYGGRSYYGAYQIPTENWDQWAAAAGIAGADIRSPQAQDTVAAFIVTQYYNRFGDWDLAAMAWYAGPQQAAKVIRRGYDGIDSILNPKIREYVTSVRDHAIEASENPEIAETQRTARLRFAIATPGSGWMHPVAGKSEYSNSFRVPRSNKSGIHGAVDVYASKGTPIVAPVPGKVLSVKKSKIGGYTARIQGDDGVVYYFAHMDGAAVVTRGQRVQSGHHIGYVGNSGNARGTSPHLHLKMTKGGALVNPYSYLQESGTVGVASPSPSVDDTKLSASTGWTPARGLNEMLQSMSDAVRVNAEPTLDDEKTVDRLTDEELAERQELA